MSTDFCNVTFHDEIVKVIESVERDVDIKLLFSIMCPIIMLICFFSVLYNAFLVEVSRRSRYVKKTQVHLLSLNLARTDVINALLNGIHVLLIAYLPEVWGIRIRRCHALMFEIIRCDAIIASAMHLLALAFVHYRGSSNPLHARSTILYSQHLSRTINMISIACWVLPLTVIIPWFYTPCQGFETKTCEHYFLYFSSYRFMVLTLFTVPLLLMSIIYMRIFYIISQRQVGGTLKANMLKSSLTIGFKCAATNQQRSTTLASTVKANSVDLEMAGGRQRDFTRKLSVVVMQAQPSILSKIDDSVQAQDQQQITEASAGGGQRPLGSTSPKRSEGTVGGSVAGSGSGSSIAGGVGTGDTGISYSVAATTNGAGANMTTLSSASYEAQRRHVNVQKNNKKALVTTLFILGSYVTFYVPTIAFQALTCYNGCRYPLHTIRYSRRILIGTTTTILLVIKTIIDPLIYAHRIQGVQTAVERYFSKRSRSSFGTSIHTESLYESRNVTRRSNQKAKTPT